MVPVTVTAATAPVIIQRRTVCCVVIPDDASANTEVIEGVNGRLQPRLGVEVMKSPEVHTETPRQPRPPVFPAGVPELDALPTLTVLRQQTTVQNKYTKDQLYCISSPKAIGPSRDVEPPTLPTLRFAPQHRPLAKAAPALAPPSTARAIDGKYGRPGEPDEDDSGPGAGYARIGRIRWRNVSATIVNLCYRSWVCEL